MFTFASQNCRTYENELPPSFLALNFFYSFCSKVSKQFALTGIGYKTTQFVTERVKVKMSKRVKLFMCV